MHQDAKRRLRNNVYRARLKSRLKEIKKAVAEKQAEKLPEMLKNAYSIIDTALKKNLIKKNNANRKKSNVARMVASLSKIAVPQA